MSNLNLAECQSVGPVGCKSCDLHEICRLGGLIAFDTGRSRQSTGSLRTVRQGEALFRAGDPAHRLFAVRQGLLKTVQLNAEGEEQILALNVPGEVLGLEALRMGTYANDVIAVQPVVCCEVSLNLVREHGARVREFGSAVVRLLAGAVVPRQSLTRGPIRQRVARFLLDLGARLAGRGLDGRQFAIGLSRQEIANLLDTRIETVSRALQALNREQVIRVRGRKVSLLNLMEAGESPMPRV
jgi:CRP/FNR family transcriptional regulator